MRETSILVVEDEPSIAEVVSLYLKRAGYRVLLERDGQAALQLMGRQIPDLLILDLMLPKVDGYEVARWVRAQGDIPIIILTARREEYDRIAGLEMGADDYVVKPFSPQELVSRVRAVLRRTRRGLEAAGERPLDFGDVTIDPQTHLVTLAGKEVTLTAVEFDMLWLMAQNPRQSSLPPAASGAGVGALRIHRSGHRHGARAPLARKDRDETHQTQCTSSHFGEWATNSSLDHHSHGVEFPRKRRSMKPVTHLRRVSLPIRYILGIIIILALSLWIFSLLMQPSMVEVGYMALLLAATAVISALAGYGLYRLGWLERSPTIRWTLLSGYASCQYLNLPECLAGCQEHVRQPA